MFENEKYIFVERVCKSQIYTLFYTRVFNCTKNKKILKIIFKKIIKNYLNPLFKIKNKNSNLEKLTQTQYIY